MSSAPLRSTAYAEYVNSNLPERVLEGQGLYTYKELAALVGLKPTQHFRRRVNDLAKRMVLEIIPSFTPRGGIENRFQFNQKNINGDYPF